MADNRKPGVMLYFQPMQEAVRELSREQRGDLLTAILNYGDPEVSQEPEFTDTALRNQWPYLKNLVDKDSVRYERRSNGHSFSQFCRWHLHFRGARTDLTQAQWEEIGCPSFKEFAGSENDTWRTDAPDTGGTNDTDDTNNTNDTTYYNVDTNPDINPGTNSSTKTDSNSSSNAVSDTTAVSPPAGRFVPPTEQEVKEYFQRKRLVVDPSYFYKYYAGRGWRGITDWRMTALSWDAKDRIEAEKRGRPFPQGTAGRYPPSEEELQASLRELHREG